MSPLRWEGPCGWTFLRVNAVADTLLSLAGSASLRRSRSRSASRGKRPSRIRTRSRRSAHEVLLASLIVASVVDLLFLPDPNPLSPRCHGRAIFSASWTGCPLYAVLYRCVFGSLRLKYNRVLRQSRPFFSPFFDHRVRHGAGYRCRRYRLLHSSICALSQLMQCSCPPRFDFSPPPHLLVLATAYARQPSALLRASMRRLNPATTVLTRRYPAPRHMNKDHAESLRFVAVTPPTLAPFALPPARLLLCFSAR